MGTRKIWNTITVKERLMKVVSEEKCIKKEHY